MEDQSPAEERDRHILRIFCTGNLLGEWRLKAGRENTDTIQWQKTFNVKEIRFTGDSDFLT